MIQLANSEQNRKIIYIGDFDIRNENVQSFLVRNNGKILNKLGYEVVYIGVNNKKNRFDSEKNESGVIMGDGNVYLELPKTLSFRGLTLYKKTARTLLTWLDEIEKKSQVSYIITYQAPTYSKILKKIVQWGKQRNIPYIVNCADLPILDSQPLYRRIVMKCNWHEMHRINRKYADGVIAVSRYINEFYKREDRPSVIIPPLFDEPDLDKANIEGNSIPTFLYAGTPFVITGSQINTKGMKDRLDIVVDLMLRLEEIKICFNFEIIGITFDDYCTCVPRHRGALMRSSNIHFFGRISHKETLKRLTAADYMINYRDKNMMTEAGMSTKVVESVSVGTPVVMNEIGDTFLYLDEGISGIKLTGEFDSDVQKLATLCALSQDIRTQNKRITRLKKTFSIDKYLPLLQVFLMSIPQKAI